MMDATEEAYKTQLSIEKDNATQFETAAAEFKRNVDRLQMDNDKLEHDADVMKSDNIQLAQQLKEAEDRVRNRSNRLLKFYPGLVISYNAQKKLCAIG